MKTKEEPVGSGIYIVHCNGCDGKHYINTKERNHNNALWRFNGDVSVPTFTPSVNISGKYEDDGMEILYRCHFTITSGTMKYESDCTHSLAGTTIELPDLP